MLFHGFFMVFSKNWVSKNWKSIDIHCWTCINEFIDGYPSIIFIDGPSMIIIDGPSMNMVPFLWAPFFGSFFGPFFGPLLLGPMGPRHLQCATPMGPGGRAAEELLKGAQMRIECAKVEAVFSWFLMVFHGFFKELEIHRYSFMDIDQ